MRVGEKECCCVTYSATGSPLREPGSTAVRGQACSARGPESQTGAQLESPGCMELGKSRPGRFLLGSRNMQPPGVWGEYRTHSACWADKCQCPVSHPSAQPGPNPTLVIYIPVSSRNKTEFPGQTPPYVRTIIEELWEGKFSYF